MYQEIQVGDHVVFGVLEHYCTEEAHSSLRLGQVAELPIQFIHTQQLLLFIAVLEQPLLELLDFLLLSI